jgi:DNA-directed RNA polymerase subunit RPC12/RpoP
MALITCHECQRQVSTEAKVCPNCGAKVVIPKPVKKPVSGQSILKGLLIGFAVLMGLSLISAFRESQKTPEEIQQETITREAVAKQRAAEDQQKVMKTQRENRAASVVSAVRHASRNPASARWESIMTNDDASVVCIAARLENGFGGMNLEYIASVNSVISNSDKAWKKYCAGKEMFDVTSIVSRMQQYMD